jgi:hypothetical protein
MMLRALRSILILGVALACGGTDVANLKPEQKIEVREGDEWSAATFLKKEGRKFQVRYDDGTEEWVTSDRVREAGKPAAAATGPTTKGAATPKKPAKEQFALGAKVEVKSASSWKAATVKNRDGDLYLIAFDKFPDKRWWEWVHPGIVRKVGSAKEWHDWGRGVKAWNDVAKAKEEARKEFANVDAEAEAATRGEKKDPFAPAAYDKPITDANLANVEDLILGAGPAKLAAFDAASSTVKLVDRAYVLNGGGGDARKAGGPTALLFAKGRAIVAYTEGRHTDTKTTTIGIVDLANGKSLGIVQPDPLSVPCDVSATCERIVGVQPGFHSGQRARVDVHKLKPGSALEHVVSFVPHSSDGSSKDVEFAQFVGDGDDKLLTASSGGTVILWDVPKVAAIWRSKLPMRSTPVLSPGRKQAAFIDDGALVVVDALTGKVLCRIESERVARSLSFSPDGKRVVGISGPSIVSWNLETGQALPDIGLPVKGAGGKVVALDGRFALVGGTDLLDLDKKVVVWRYNASVGDDAQMHGGLCWRVLTDEHRRSILACAKLPHTAARKSADGVTLGQGLLLQPGGSVALSVAIDAPGDQQQRIIEAMTAQLRQAGISVDPNSPIKLNARTEQGKTSTQTYREIGRPFGDTTTVSVTEKITRVWLESNGKIAWESRTSSGGAPMFISRKEGQDINAAVQAGSQFNLAFLESVRVPAYVPQPHDMPWLGESTWGVAGVTKDRLNPNAPRAAALAAPAKPAGPAANDGF